MTEQEFQIQDTIHKMKQVLGDHENILISISGGSDSDCLIELFQNHEDVTPNHKLHYVFFDTGLEYDATKRHLIYLEKKYNISIERERAVVPIPLAIKKYGSPLISKQADQKLATLQNNNFDFKNDALKSPEFLHEKYPNCKMAIMWWTQTHSLGAYNVSNKAKNWIINNHERLPRVSNRCCNFAKKDVSKKYLKKHPEITCIIVGMRQSEGGARTVSMRKSGCYFEHNSGKHYYYPLSLWTDEIKAHYKQTREIIYNDCYEVWGMPRTGCVMCPYSKTYNKDRELAKQYEPQLYKAGNNLFGKSHAIKDEINSIENKRQAKENKRR